MGAYIHLPWQLLCYCKEPEMVPNGFFTVMHRGDSVHAANRLPLVKQASFVHGGEKWKDFKPRALTFPKAARKSGGSIQRSSAACPSAGSRAQVLQAPSHAGSLLSFSFITSVLVADEPQN